MPAGIDLDLYLNHIGYTGSRTPTIETLQALHALHPASIAFENLNPLLGWPVALDIAALQDKLLTQGRGGWCFEHNTLFCHALEALGFSVQNLAARVVWNAPTGVVGPRSHMLLLVVLEGKPYIADVGFGGNVLTAPLRLERQVAQMTPHEPHRFMPLENGYVLEGMLRGKWEPFYRFTLEPQFPADYEVSNWYLLNHPNSFFRQTLIAARATSAGRYALRNNSLAVHRKDGTEKRTLTTAGELRHCLEHDFAIHLPESVSLTSLLERLAELPADAA